MPNRISNAPAPVVRQPRPHAPAQAPVQRAPAQAGWQPRTNAPARPRPAAPPRPLVSTGNPRLDLIANAQLRNGKDHTCVSTVRANLHRLGFQGVPGNTGQDPNNPRGMMVQMLQSDHWQSANIPGATPQTIKSPYGTVQANVLSHEAYLVAAKAGQIPQGAVVFQTQHGWKYNGGSRGNDVGLVQGDHVHNYREMRGMSVYGAATRDIVVLLPSA